MGSDKPFQNQVAVVVGAANGIGLATAAEFKSQGATVAWLDKSAEVKKCATAGDIAFEIDATIYEDTQKLAVEIHRRFQRIDHVVVSIGMCSGTLGFPFWNLDPGVWQRSIEVNLIAAVNVAHAFVPHMLSHSRGTFCFVSSVAGQIGSQTDPPYSAAKAGLINFVQCAAKDLAAYNIRANAVSPGMVKTELNKQVWQAWSNSSQSNTLGYDKWAEEKIKSIAPLGRWQTGEDIADAIVFLASSRAKNITGQTLNVDGGQVMHS